jgi:histidinol-phosphate phosphatase family protein
LIVFADVMIWMDYATLVERHLSAGALITAVVHPNDHPDDSDLVEIDESGWVTALRRKPRSATTACRNLAVAGVFVLEPEALSRLAPSGHLDLVHDLLGPAVERGRRVLAYRTTEYLKDCGTPERYAHVYADFDAGRVRAFYRTTPRPALFIDRDGTVNRHVGYVTRPEQLELLPGAGTAIRRLNQAGVLAVLVTNQPIIARGECSAARLEHIHARLETLLGAEGAFLDGVYTCPHHPDRGYPGEVAELKISCGCRKPEPGLVLRAARELPLDLGRSAVVGDSDCDVALAQRLGLTAFRVSPDTQCELDVTSVQDLTEAVGRWLDMVGDKTPIS